MLPTWGKGTGKSMQGFFLPEECMLWSFSRTLSEEKWCFQRVLEGISRARRNQNPLCPLPGLLSPCPAWKHLHASSEQGRMQTSPPPPPQAEMSPGLVAHQGATCKQRRCAETWPGADLQSRAAQRAPRTVLPARPESAAHSPLLQLLASQLPWWHRCLQPSCCVLVTVPELCWDHNS